MAHWIKFLGVMLMLGWLFAFLLANSYHRYPLLDPLTQSLNWGARALALRSVAVQPRPASWTVSMSPTESGKPSSSLRLTPSESISSKSLLLGVSECGKPVLVEFHPTWGNKGEQWVLPKNIADLEAFDFLPQLRIIGYGASENRTVDR